MSRLGQGRRGTLARGASMLFIVIAAVLLALGLLAGVVNHEILDGPRFAGQQAERQQHGGNDDERHRRAAS